MSAVGRVLSATGIVGRTIAVTIARLLMDLAMLFVALVIMGVVVGAVAGLLMFAGLPPQVGLALGIVVGLAGLFLVNRRLDGGILGTRLTPERFGFLARSESDQT